MRVLGLIALAMICLSTWNYWAHQPTKAENAARLAALEAEVHANCSDPYGDCRP
jgi:hypothetical protein